MAEGMKDRWALVLGVSSGFGAAAAVALAGEGFHVAGVHLDRRSTMAGAVRVEDEIRRQGREALFFNLNAADPGRRSEVIGTLARRPADIRLMLHSLAFGTLKPFLAEESAGRIRPADLNMTLEVMAHSLVYWTQELRDAGLLTRGAQIYAMTSAGARRVWPTYGAVSAAKAALEAHVRQLAVELAPEGIAVNALQAGVTDTPAARRIPGSDAMLAAARAANPGGRLTEPEDIASVLVALSRSASARMTGNIIRVDGGEDLV